MLPSFSSIRVQGLDSNLKRRSWSLDQLDIINEVVNRTGVTKTKAERAVKPFLRAEESFLRGRPH